ncbi:MAG TPA: hypothetical protein DD729_01985 [Rhodobacteraceae bacterium]|jgi:tetratricopeptide (TPR) repeat protein|nr:hypothetical protein [Paracoccaceae bacterium]
MRIYNPLSKQIVTVLLFAVLFCLPLAAQEQTIDDLFDDLRAAPVGQADRIADKINGIWSKSGSASMDLLLKRGRDALDDGQTQAAIEHFTALIDHAPDFAQAYSMRAAAYHKANYFGPALFDLQSALALNPRHFGAMTGLGALQEAMEQPQKALENYRRVLEIMPQNEDIQKAVARLEGMAL